MSHKEREKAWRGVPLWSHLSRIQPLSLLPNTDLCTTTNTTHHQLRGFLFLDGLEAQRFLCLAATLVVEPALQVKQMHHQVSHEFALALRARWCGSLKDIRAKVLKRRSGHRFLPRAAKL